MISEKTQNEVDSGLMGVLRKSAEQSTLFYARGQSSMFNQRQDLACCWCFFI